MKKLIEWIKKDRHWAMIVLAVLFSAWVIGFANHFMSAKSDQRRSNNFSIQCAENKGIPVRDLEGKMRCVPMFSASRNLQSTPAVQAGKGYKS